MNDFAQLDENNIVFSILTSSNPEGLQGNFVALSARDESLLGKKYVDGSFINVATPAEVLSPPLPLP